MYNSSNRGRSYRPANSSRSRYGGRPKSNKKYIDPSRFIKKATPQKALEYVVTNQFADLDLHPDLHKAIAIRGFVTPSPIQDQAIPHALTGRDIVGIANTGTGKTAAFLIPLVNKLLADKNQQVLVVAPTRELALQIQNDFRLLTDKMGLYSTLCIGGTSLYKQISSLARGPHLIIGTPGRLKDLLQRKKLRLDRCYSVVLDEVDRMVDMGFINDMKAILSQLPATRQSLFMTATISPNVEVIMNTFLKDPIKIEVKTGETADNVNQDVIRLGRGEDKRTRLHELLMESSLEKVLIFGETKHGVEKLTQHLNTCGINAVSIHGDKSQSQRQNALRRFRDNAARVMVATDVAARGLDIKDITHVINYELPQTYDDYCHRIGRTGRAGKVGQALTFVV